jgi:hypothetical protein
MRLLTLVLVPLLAAACASGELSPQPGAPSAEPAVAQPAPAAPAVAEPAAADRGEGAYPGFSVPAFKAQIRRPGAAASGFDSRKTAAPTLYIVNSAKCPTCIVYADRMKEIETKYMAKGVDVVHLYPNKKEKETDAEKTAYHAEKGFRGGLILDTGGAVSKRLEAERTPTVYLADARGTIVYRGGIDSSAYAKMGQEPWLADAIDAFLAHRPIENDTTEPSG